MVGTSLLQKSAGSFTGAGATGFPLTGVDWWDPVLGELIAPGTVFRIDPTNPVAPWPAGFPAANAVLPNLALSQCKTLLGSATDSDAQPSWKRSGSYDGSQFVQERSGKGGVHVSPSQTTFSSANAVFLRASSAVEAYIHAHPSDIWYMSVSGRVTRPPTTTTNIPAYSSIAQSTPRTNYLMRAHGSGVSPATNGFQAGATGYSTAGGTVSGDFFRAVTTTAWTGTAPASAASLFALLGLWGSAFDNLTALNNPSWILHTFTLENITASRVSLPTRTAAAVQTLDYASYLASHAANGKWSSDTYTSLAA